jgi:hypothetical protein
VLLTPDVYRLTERECFTKDQVNGCAARMSPAPVKELPSSVKSEVLTCTDRFTCGSCCPGDEEVS